ncbi:predicted protein [Streptomyces sp. SPB78]|nr:predicted protein [Streptomyces sp. SPB78]
MPPGRSWSDAERQHWAELFRSPAASQWDDSVGLAVASLVVATSAIIGGGRISAQLVGEQRALMAELGLTPASMERLRWVIGEPPEHGRTT